MEEIKDFETLFKIQDEEYKSTCVLDLLFIRDHHTLIDGYALVIGADCKEHLKLYYLSFNTYKKLTDGEKDYLQRYYGIEKRSF